MQRHYLYIATFLVWLSCLSTYGQSYDRGSDFGDDPLLFKKNNVSFSLLPLLQNGIDLSYARKVADRNRLKIGVSHYRSQDYRQSRPTDLRSMQGYGFKLQHRYIPYSNIPLHLALFLDYGPSYSKFSLETKNLREAEFEKYNFECAIGLHKVFSNVFFFEFYGGLASSYRRGIDIGKVELSAILQDQDQFWFGYGNAGNYIIIGITIGVLF
jgi:hypothetical protein